MDQPRRVARILVTTALAVVVASSGLAACSAGGAATNGTGGSDGGTLTYAAASSPDSWDPHVSPATMAGLLLRPVFDSLVEQTPDGNFAPWLASSWTVSGDGRTYTFNLRKDVTFSDGTRFDAQAVKENFDHIVAPQTASKSAAAMMGPYERTEVVSEFVAAVHLKAPYSSFLQAVSTTYLGFHSPKSLREHAGDLSSGGPFVVSTGPFVFASVTPGQQAVFRRRDDYAWAPASAKHTGKAHLGQFTVKFLTESATRVGALTSGQVDVADEIPSVRLAPLRAQNGVELVRTGTPGAPYSYYLNTERAPFNDINARLAVRSAIDMDAIVKGVFQGEYGRAFGPLTSSSVAFDSSLNGNWSHDKARAGQLLDQLGYTGRDADGYRTKDGKRFSIQMPYVQTFVSAEHHTLDVAVQDALKQVGVELALVPLDSASSQGRTRGGDYDVFAFSWGGADPGLLYSLFHSSKQFATGGANGARVRDPKLDELLDSARAETDQAKRAGIYHQIQKRVTEQAYAVPAYESVRDTAARNRVHDLTFDVRGWPDFYDVRVDGL
ncbi:MAG: ABC transporter substrate-binding protein [Kibdelosporangium sp.]